MRLSVLDLVPVRTDQSTSDALAASTQLAQTADRLGYTRFWVAEHHNMPSVAATSPPVVSAGEQLVNDLRTASINLPGNMPRYFMRISTTQAAANGYRNDFSTAANAS